MGNKTSESYVSQRLDRFFEETQAPAGEPMSFEEARRKGLCSTCSNDPICTLPGGVDAPIIFCEEFDDSLPASQIADLKEAGNRDPSVEDEKEYIGLCMNCEQRAVCRFTKPEGGVWYCEEYE